MESATRRPHEVKASVDLIAARGYKVKMDWHTMIEQVMCVRFKAADI